VDLTFFLFDNDCSKVHEQNKYRQPMIYGSDKRAKEKFILFIWTYQVIIFHLSKGLSFAIKYM
jgi:hypothetical protein